MQVLLANVLVKIGAVFTVALPLVWLGGLLYHCTSGETLQVSLFKVYAVLYRAPGMQHFIPHYAHTAAQLPARASLGVCNLDTVKTGIYVGILVPCRRDSTCMQCLQASFDSTCIVVGVSVLLMV